MDHVLITDCDHPDVDVDVERAVFTAAGLDVVGHDVIRPNEPWFPLLSLDELLLTSDVVRVSRWAGR